MATDVKESVSVVGTGRMGAAMVARLRDAGHPVVVFNRTGERAAEVAALTGATVAGTPREAAEAAGVIIVSLADDAAAAATYAGPDGLVAGLRPGVVVLEASTLAPQTVRALGSDVGARGATLLDAPVSGSVPVVQRGELTFMVGGDPAALDRVRPVLAPLAAEVFHVGAPGAGAAMKLAVNAVVLGLNQALSESLVLAERSGIDRATAYRVFAASAVAAPYVRYKREAFERPDDTPVAFMLSLVAKDLTLIGALAADTGARMDQSAANLRVAQEAVDAGYGTRDISAVAAYLRDA